MADRKLAMTLAFNGTGNLSNMMRRMAGEGGQAKEALRGLNLEARNQKREMKALEACMKGASGNVTHLLDRQKALASEMARTTQQIQRQKSAIDRQTRADNMGAAARDSGTRNMTVGVGTATGLAAAGKVAADFQDGMTDIQQKADLTNRETAKLKGNILAAAKAAHQLPEAMRAGVDTLAGFGLSPAQAANMMKPIGRAATAYRAEIADLSAAGFAAVDNLKVPINETGRALDAMAMAGKMGAFELKDMAVYFPALTAQAQAFKQTGVSAVSDLAAALQIARKAAGSSEVAARNVENLLAKINTEETIKKFAKFGVDLPKEMKKAYAAGKTPLEAIAELSNKAVGGNLENLSFLFGDMQAQNALRPLIQNLGEYRKIRTSAMQASGVVDADFALRAQNASAQARALTGNLMSAAMTIGDKLLPQFVAASEWTGRMADRFSAWASQNPKTLSLLVQLVTMFAALNLTVGASRLLFGNLVGPTMSLANALIFLSKPGGAAAVVQKFGMIGGAAMTLGRSLAAAGAFMLANPLVLAITALMALLVIAVPWIIKNWDALKAGFTAFGASLYESFRPAIETAQRFMAFLGGIWERVRGPLAQGLQVVMQYFMNFTPLGWIIRGIQPIIAWLTSIDWGGLGKMMIQGIIDGIFLMMGPLGQAFKKAAAAGIDAFKQKAQIRSPSRVMMGMGGYMSTGLALGMERGMTRPIQAARRLAAATIGAAALTGAPGMAASPGMTPPPARASAGFAFGNLTFNIYAQPGDSPQDIADAVREVLENMADHKGATSRSSFDDPED